MSKLLSALIAAGFGLGVNVAMAQNTNSNQETIPGQGKQEAVKENPSSSQQGQSSADKGNKANPPAPGTVESVNTSRNCEKFTGKEKDKCIQATPAGPTDVRTGEGSRAKSQEAKDRDAAKGQETGTNADAIPEQSKDTVGHPKERSTTGQGQTLDEQGGTSSTGSNR